MNETLQRCPSCNSVAPKVRGETYHDRRGFLEICGDPFHTAPVPAELCNDLGCLAHNLQPEPAEASPEPPRSPDPYPFDEIVDDKQAVRFNMDGTAWCTNRLPFTNMMEMAQGFGDTPMQALVDLITQEAAEKPAAAPTGTGEGSESRAAFEKWAEEFEGSGQIRTDIWECWQAAQSCSNAALRSRLAEAQEDYELLAEKLVEARRDLATAQARIAQLEEGLREIQDSTGEGIDCRLMADRALAESQSGEK